MGSRIGLHASAVSRISWITRIGCAAALLSAPFFLSGRALAQAATQKFDPSLQAVMELVERNEATRALIVSYDVEFETHTEGYLPRRAVGSSGTRVRDPDFVADPAHAGALLRIRSGQGRVVRDGQRHRGFYDYENSFPELDETSTHTSRQVRNDQYFARWRPDDQKSKSHPPVYRTDLPWDKDRMQGSSKAHRGPNFSVRSPTDIMSKGWGSSISTLRQTIEGVQKIEGSRVRVRPGRDEAGRAVQIMEYFFAPRPDRDPSIPTITYTFDTERGYIITEIVEMAYALDSPHWIRRVEPRLVDGLWVPYEFHEVRFCGQDSSLGDPGSIKSKTDMRITKLSINQKIDPVEFELGALGFPADKTEIICRRTDGTTDLLGIRDGELVTVMELKHFYPPSQPGRQ